MYPRRDDASDLYGYWERDGWAIRPQFAYAHTFRNGYAAVSLVDDLSGLIGMDGKLLPLDAICCGRTPFRDEFTFFTGFGDFDLQVSQYADVCTENRGRREWGLVDTSLTYRPLPDEVFSGVTSVKVCGEYLVLTQKHGRGYESSSGLFNLHDRRLELPVDYSCIYPSRESFWVVSRNIGKHQEIRRNAFYDPSKREIISDWFWEAMPFSCGLGAIRETQDGRWYFVDETLRPAFEGEFDGVGRVSYGLAAVYKDSDAGYIDTTGRTRLLLPYDDLQPFNEFGLAIANRDQLEWDIDIIDRDGRPRLSGLETAVFWEGDFPHFQVSKDGKDHLFDTNCKLIF
jgi:hypothetical protein